MNFVEAIGAGFLGFVEETGRVSRFFLQTCYWLIRPPFRFRLVLEQFIFVANKSAFIVCLTGAFSGMVSSVQIYFGFRVINGDALVGPAVAVGFAREFAPVFTAIVVTGRAGAAMAAQLGTMRVTEQIDAMDVMAVNSIHYLVVPRIVASFIALPLLSALFMFVGNIGSYLTGVFLLSIDPVIYFAHLQEFVQPRDVAQGLIKAAIFGIIFSTIGTFKGYFTKGGAEAVGRSTNEAVVETIVLILVIDYFLTLMIRALMYRTV